MVAFWRRSDLDGCGSSLGHEGQRQGNDDRRANSLRGSRGEQDADCWGDSGSFAISGRSRRGDGLSHGRKREVMAAVKSNEAGIASGVDNAVRTLGGVFGVAVLGAIFNRPDVYHSADSFVSGFRSALWVAVAFSAIGVPLALYIKRAGRLPGARSEEGPGEQPHISDVDVQSAQQAIR